MVDTELHTIKLPYPDKDDRTVWVYVPSHSDGEKLLVVYMTDGQNLFDDNSTPHGSWEVVKAVENEQKSGVGNAVIVGIDNGNVWRDSELTPKSIGMLKIISPYAPTDRMLPSAEAHRADLCHFFRLLNTRKNSAMQVCFLLHFSVTQERIGRNIFRQKLLKICRTSTSIRVTVMNLKR